MIYVDNLVDYGWKLRGRVTKSCHLFTENIDLEELHVFAESIGLKRSWFQDKPGHPHYDLTPLRRAAAIKAGAKSVPGHEMVVIFRERERSINADIQD